ncbi:G-protein coupled receptor GRL101-like [Mytilus galloprovincialis]|uniref:G-protein coupled receptor GRL101-like n=1 Tax=Mytilus galloprovincialis TaxID=29158 RepID=UPI003F7CB5C2
MEYIYFKRCNCGNEPYDWYSADDNEIRSDSGVLKHNKDLPVKRIRAEWTASVDSFVKVHLGPLECEEEQFICPPGYLKCQDSYCIPPKLLCNGIQDCPRGEDEYKCRNYFLQNIYPESFSGLHSLPMISFQQSNLQLLTENTFAGLKRLKTLNLTENKIQMVEDRSFAGLTNLKSLDIRGNKIVKFQKNIFEGPTNLKKLYSDAFVFCCLRPDSVKEEDCLPARDEFSSCSDMMRNDILRTCLWIIGICGLFGNFFVLAYRIFYYRKSLSKSYGIFITSLGTSDCLMGIYMLTIASADVMFRGNYVWNDLSWRYGVSCKIAGILSTVSSECSVVFLFLITIDRFIAVKYPFGEIRFGKKSAIRISVFVFVTSFILAVVPLLPGSYFDGSFYSRSAVCLALPLTRDKPNGWEYSFGIFIVFNFILFVIIAVTQLVIYKEVTNPIHIRSTKKNQDLVIARKLFLVVFSDFLCWFPVGVMGLMALRGHVIPSEVYAWTAVFILPINSALNPFLYTFASIKENRRLQKKKTYQTESSNSKRSNV